MLVHLVADGGKNSLLTDILSLAEASTAVMALSPGNGELGLDCQRLGLEYHAPPSRLDRRSQVVWLTRWVRRLAPSTMVSHGSQASYLMLLAGAASLRPVRRVAVRHHNLENHLLGRRRAVQVDRLIAKRATLTIAVSQAVRDTLVAEGANSSSVRVIHNASSIGSHSAATMPQSDSKQEVLAIALGRLDLLKDYPTMLRAVRAVRERNVPLRLDIYGQGTARVHELVSGQCRQMGLGEVVRFRGFTRTPAVELGRADLLLHTSRDEAFGMSVLEGLLTGTPVVATNSPGVREVVNGRYALASVGDVAALADLMVESIAHIQPLKSYAARIAPQVQEEFQVSEMARMYASLDFS